MSRTVQKITQEYGKEKWGVMLGENLKDIEHAKIVEFNTTIGPNWQDATTTASFGGELFRVNQQIFRDIYFAVLRSKFLKYRGSAYCELGCGYGYNLSQLPGPTYGGEFTDAGVAIGKKLGLDVSHFDFYDKLSYRMIRPGSVVFTVQALEQIPDSTCFLDGMRSQKHNIEYVLHLEGSVLPERRDLLGLLRNRYQQINDYNRNLVELLRTAPDVELLELELDLMGCPPLNSLHFVAWRFKTQ
jgi:hypothetical protein